MRVYKIGKDCQASEIGTGEAARRFLAWLAGDANPVLTKAIHSWMWEPADAGGLGALAESIGDLAMLRAEVIAAWQPSPGDQPAREGEAR